MNTDYSDGLHYMPHKVRFDLVTRLGRDMLMSGSEIFRTKEAMHIAAQALGLEEFEVYLLTNGIFATTTVEGRLYSGRIFQVPLAPIMLQRVDELNALSRKIARGECGPLEIAAELERIENMPMPAPGVQVFGAAIGSLGFCYLFRGTVADSFLAFTAGALLYIFILWILRDFIPSKLMRTSVCALFVGLLVCGMLHLGWGDSLDSAMIGAIFPLVPGVPLTNAFRNFMENDYLSGLIRLIDALLTAGALAVGVGMAISLSLRLGLIV